MKNRSRGRWMNSRGFNCVLFSSGDRKKWQKKEQAWRVKRWQKAGTRQKAHCKGHKCPRKEGERKERHHWLVPWTHCKQRGVQPRMTDVPGHCYPSSLLSASCSSYGISRDGLRLWELFKTPRLSPCVPHCHPSCSDIQPFLTWEWGFYSQRGFLVRYQKLYYLLDAAVPTTLLFVTPTFLRCLNT